MKLSDRKKKILSAVISENLKSADAVSSKDIQEKYYKDISSATIRNELMSLEELGLLGKAHTSSGRVPTEEGFKAYISELMPEKKLTKKELSLIKESFDGRMTEMESLAKNAAKAISSATNYASIVYFGVLDNAKIESVKIVKITDDSALVVVVTDVGIIKDITMQSSAKITDEDYALASKLLTEALSGKTLAEVQSPDKFVDKIATKYRVMFNMVLSVIEKHGKDSEPLIDGTGKLLEQPEYQDISRAKHAISIFENKDTLLPLLKDNNDIEISVKVGADSGLNDCSVVTAEFKINGKSIGHAGVIGPMRMDYAKAISVLKSVSETISDKFYNKGDGSGEKRK